jgi:hypothetical protein
MVFIFGIKRLSSFKEKGTRKQGERKQYFGFLKNRDGFFFHMKRRYNELRCKNVDRSLSIIGIGKFQ